MTSSPTPAVLPDARALKPPVINQRQRDLLREIADQPLYQGKRIPYAIPLSASHRDSASLAALRAKGLVTTERNFARLTDAGQRMADACDNLFGKGSRHHAR